MFVAFPCVIIGVWLLPFRKTTSKSARVSRTYRHMVCKKTKKKKKRRKNKKKKKKKKNKKQKKSFFLKNGAVPFSRQGGEPNDVVGDLRVYCTKSQDDKDPTSDSRL